MGRLDASAPIGLRVPLTDLQVRLGELFRTVDGADEFVLAGGGAMAVLGIGDRATKDLDWFAEGAEAVERFAPRFVQACTRDGLQIAEVLSQAGFRRFEISDAREATVVDLAWDARLRAPQEVRFGRVLDRDELAADKTLALFGRAAPRDFVDVYRLREFYSREQLCALAAEKDRGFDKSMFSEMIAKVLVYERKDFAVDDPTFRDLQNEFDAWHRDLMPARKLDPPAPDVRRTRAPEPPGIELD